MHIQLAKTRVNDYFNSTALNSHKLSMVTYPKALYKYIYNPDIEDDDKKHFRIGSALDSILTDPERFPEEFCVSYESRPGGLMGVFIDKLPSNLTEESDIELYREAYTKAGYKAKI